MGACLNCPNYAEKILSVLKTVCERFIQLQEKGQKAAGTRRGSRVLIKEGLGLKARSWTLVA